MAATSSPQNKRVLARINAVRGEVTDPFLVDALDYIARQITPAGMLRRSEDDQDVSHLHERASQIVAPYEKRKARRDA